MAFSKAQIPGISDSLAKQSSHIVILNEFFYPDQEGGTASAVANLARALTQRPEFTVSVVTSANSYRKLNANYAPFEKWEELEIHRVSAPDWSRQSTTKRFLGNLIYTFGAFRKLFRLKKIDYVIVTTAPVPQPLAAYWFRKLRKAPYLYLLYDVDPDRTVALGVKSSDSLAVKILTAGQAKWLSAAHLVLPIGRCMKELIETRYKVAASKIKVIEVGGSDANFLPTLTTQFRNREGFANKFVVLYSGNLGQYHDFETLLSAAEVIEPTEAEIEIVIVGDGARKIETVQRAAQLNLKNVSFFDYVSKDALADLLSSADVHVITLSEGMEGLCVPSKLYSCLASGRPIIGIVPAASEVALTIAEGQCGLVVSPGDVQGLIQALKIYQNDPERCELEGANGRKLFLNKYSVEIVAERFADLVSQIL